MSVQPTPKSSEMSVQPTPAPVQPIPASVQPIPASVQPTPAWRAKPRCPKHLVAVLERAVNALPPAWLLQPTTGEVFDSIEYCKRRLQGYALAEGFKVIRTRGGTKKAPRARFGCSKHGESIRN